MLRDAMKLAQLIAQGVIKFDHSNPCTTDGCTTPLMTPVAFNATSRLDGKRICDACDAWEFMHRTKQPGR